MGGVPLKQQVNPKKVLVLPDIPAIDKELTYLVPPKLANEPMPVGSIVRIPLKGRKVRGWVTKELDPEFRPNYEILPIDNLVSVGPPKEVLELANWAAKRWVSKKTAFYRAASPHRNIKQIDFPSPGYDWPQISPSHKIISKAIKASGILRVPPDFDRWQIIETALQFSPPLILCPAPHKAQNIANRLSDLGLPVALLPDQWGEASRQGFVVVGTRAGVFAPILRPGMILVLEEQDSAYWSDASPTYNTREIAQKRAKDLNVPCLLISSTPSQEALKSSQLFKLNRREELLGWPRVEVVNTMDPERRREGLITEPLLYHLRQKDKKVICILNRKGRVRLLSCAKCEELVSCKRCGSYLRQSNPDTFDCVKCQMSRTSSCRHCNSRKFKNLRLGVSKVKENLETLLRESVGELTADTRASSTKSPASRVIVATTAVLYGEIEADVVAFLDFDQELLSPNIRAYENALGLLSRAGMLLGKRKNHKSLLIQTRMPDHVVIQSAKAGNPDILSQVELQLRTELGFPPIKAVAEIARSGADDFIAELKKHLQESVKTSTKVKSASKSEIPNLEILGPVEGAYLVRADTTQELSDILGNIPRPPKKDIRIAINPAVF